jgi:hypothetical protein
MTGQEGTRIAKLRPETTTPQVQMANLFSKTKLFWPLQGQVPEIVLDRQFINHAWHAGPSMYASTSPTGVVLAMQVGPPVGVPVTGAIPCLRKPDSLEALQRFMTRNILQNITTSIKHLDILDEPAALRVNTIQGGV